MKMGDSKAKQGFTIIEVALVLAIAGLIFLMVFVALPALQRSQRDARRRDDVISFLSEVKKYQTNNRGALPGGSDTINDGGSLTVTVSSTGADTKWAGFYRSYLGNNFVDPSGDNYKLQIIKCGASVADANCENNVLSNLYTAAFPNDYKMVVVLQATCYGDRAVGSSNPRKLAVLYKLEGAGVYCNNT